MQYQACLFLLLVLTSSVQSTLTSSDQQTLITLHNQARAAVGLAPLTWDTAAALTAQNYANLCNYAHNANRNTDYTSNGGNAQGVGENIAAGAPTEDVATATNSWTGEESSWDCQDNTCSADCGHYTQVVWQGTTAFGCGKASCTTNSPFGSSFPDWDFIVCDYNPPGNYVGERPFPVTNCGGATAPAQTSANTPVQTSANTPVQTSANTPVQTSTPAQGSAYCVSANPGLNIRSAPCTTASRVTYAPLGDSVTSLSCCTTGCGRSWRQVSYGGVTGYAIDAYLFACTPLGAYTGNATYSPTAQCLNPLPSGSSSFQVTALFVLALVALLI